MRWRISSAFVALFLYGCPGGGDGSGTADMQPDGTVGTLDGGVDMVVQPDMLVAPDMVVPDMAVAPDMVVPDMAVSPDMVVPDMAIEPDMMMPDMIAPACEVGESRACPGECAGGQQDCAPDGTWAECVFPEETCNGNDDDCDGNTDEDFGDLGAACSVGQGACAVAGEQVCGADGQTVVCNAVAGPAQPEACNGVDDDCDGATDENLVQACYDGPEGTLGQGACREGTRACEDGAFGACMNAVLPQDETCDSVDNDCDGVLDEAAGGVALVEACYDGPDGTQNVGRCQGGQRTCVGGVFGPCEGQALPGVEICDTVDNDCNGEVDDTAGGCECQPDEVGDCYSGPAGTEGVGICAGGTQACDENGRFGACQNEQLPESEACDGVDNDCDGEIDNDIAGVGVECQVGTGACQADGVTVCDSERGQVTCAAEEGVAAPETCNAIDDDCDGSTDEGLGLGDGCRVGVGACVANGVQVCGEAGDVICDAQPGEARAELCNNVDDDCDGTIDEGLGLGEACGVGVGACGREGVQICDDAGQVRCSVEAGEPADEACDGLDNDCDGSLDEGNPGGGQDCDTGLDGVCSAGERICAAGEFACEQRVFPSEEVCDSLDNDCNGLTDDNNGDGPLQRDCYDGPDGTRDVGVCRGGLSSCVGGVFGACAGQVVPRPEVCDTADNDCNGAVDDLPAGMCVCEPGEQRDCYSGEANTQDVGVCRAGRQTCQANGQGYGACEGEVLPGAEICDGADNDCNGTIDDAAGVGIDCSSGEGECRRDGSLICDPGSGQLVCDAEPGERQPEICDGLDNDCDGVRDNVEGLGDRCSNGVGTCARGGNLVCDLNARVLVCNAEPGEPDEAEICDGLDNDCDETTDERIRLDEVCTVGVGECRRLGEPFCAGAEGVQCSVEPGEPQPEQCDFRDNDCDGEIDEDAQGVGEICTLGQGICEREGVFFCDVEGGLLCNAQPAPREQELCDELDNDCDGETDEGLDCTVYRSCAHARQSGAVADGIYLIDADGAGAGAPQSVWCDQTTDGGGWTLVGSRSVDPLSDEAAEWHAGLTTLEPNNAVRGIWGGLRPLGDRFDVRFTCRAAIGAANAPFDVDLSFYDTGWYTEFTTGTEAESCFSESNGSGADSPVPARRDNIGQRFRRRTDRYGAGYMEGEDNCAAPTDFTVDFDDRGMDSEQGDGTDWGEDDESRKCGADGLATGQWFVWARERPRVAVVGLNESVVTVLRDAGILAERLVYDDTLPGKLTRENYDTIVIGRYATRWARMTQSLKEALDVFGRDGGNIVTEWEGAAIFMSVYDRTFRYAEGAPQQLGWFGGRIGAGDSRGANTPITQSRPDDPIFDDVPNPFRGGTATEFFFTLDDVGGVEFPVLLETETLATFPGNGTAEFPQGNLNAIVRGRYCGGNMIFAPFDWQDDPDAAGFGALVPNLVDAANQPPAAHLKEACKNPTRSVQMRCGRSTRNVFEFGISSRLVESCVPNDSVQVMWITRSGIADLDGPRLRTYVRNGGIIVGEYSASDEIYNAVFGGNVEQGERFGTCDDNVMPTLTASPENGFWQDNLHEPLPNDTGCGHDLSAFPNLVRLGGWTPETTQLAYRDLGKGRVWFVEADWQDNNQMTDTSKGLMRYMATHAAGGNSVRGATFSGVRIDQNINAYLQRGFRPCLRTAYNSQVSLDDVQAACHGDVLMMGCREVGSNILRVAAVGARNEVFEDVGNANDAVNPHNGVNWYYSASRSWGFAPGGQAVNRNTCDTNNDDSNDRICWHTNNDRMTSGWRCGNQRGLNSAEWERVVLDRFGDVPVDIILQ